MSDRRILFQPSIISGAGPGALGGVSVRGAISKGQPDSCVSHVSGLCAQLVVSVLSPPKTPIRTGINIFIMMCVDTLLLPDIGYCVERNEHRSWLLHGPYGVGEETGTRCSRRWAKRGIILYMGAPKRGRRRGRRLPNGGRHTRRARTDACCRAPGRRGGAPRQQPRRARWRRRCVPSGRPPTTASASDGGRCGARRKR